MRAASYRWPATSPARRCTPGAGCPPRAPTGAPPPRTCCSSSPSWSPTPACTPRARTRCPDLLRQQGDPRRGLRPRHGPARPPHPAPRRPPRRPRHVHRAAALPGLGGRPQPRESPARRSGRSWARPPRACPVGLRPRPGRSLSPCWAGPSALLGRPAGLPGRRSPRVTRGHPGRPARPVHAPPPSRPPHLDHSSTRAGSSRLRRAPCLPSSRPGRTLTADLMSRQ